MKMLVISTVTFTLLVHTGCYTPVSDEYMTLQDLLKLHRKGPISLEFPAGLSARKYHVIKRQDGGSSESVIDRTVVTQMCDQLNKTHLILDNILAQIRADFQNTQHIKTLQDLPPIEQLQLPDVYIPGSSAIFRHAYSQLYTALNLSKLVDSQMRSVPRSTSLTDPILNALAQIESGIGVNGYYGILHMLRSIYFETQGMVNSELVHEEPVYLRSVATRSEALNNAYYVLYNIDSMMKGLLRRMMTLQ